MAWLRRGSWGALSATLSATLCATLCAAHVVGEVERGERCAREGQRIEDGEQRA